MDFREEYKKSMESNSPDRETIDRMKAAVMAQLENSTQNEVPEKKPLNMRRMYYAFGALAACAVIAVSAATILPNINSNNGMISEAESQASAVEADTAADAAEDNSADMITMEKTQDSGTYTATEEVCDDSADSANYDRFQSWDIDNGDRDNGGWEDGITDSVVSIDSMPSKSEVTSGEITTYEPEDTSKGHGSGDIIDPDDFDDKMNPDTGFGTAEDMCATEDPDMDNPNSGDNSIDQWEETGEVAEETSDCIEMTEEVVDSEESTDSSENVTKIIFSGKGWITYDGERYNEVNDKNGGGSIMTAYDPINKTYYNVVLNGNKLLVYDMNMYIIGAYIHA